MDERQRRRMFDMRQSTTVPDTSILGGGENLCNNPVEANGCTPRVPVADPTRSPNHAASRVFVLKRARRRSSPASGSSPCGVVCLRPMVPPRSRPAGSLFCVNLQGCRGLAARMRFGGFGGTFGYCGGFRLYRADVGKGSPGEALNH